MSKPEPSETRPRIMVVDDEPLICWSIEQHMKQAGYPVQTARSGEACLEQLDAFRPAIIFLDVRMPGIDGTEVLRRVRERYPEIVVIMLSAHGTVDLAVHAMKLGATDFVTKPFDLEALERMVARVAENLRVRGEVGAPSGERPREEDNQMVGASPAMHQVRDLVRLVAKSLSSIALIRGESGTGKAVIGRAIHDQSSRAEYPYLAINCTNIPDHLVESELFGYERGAFTDAKTQKKGLFELAEGGTVLLDEIGDMPVTSQAKLLQFLETRTFKRVGGTADVQVQIRLLAATNQRLEQLVADGRFRQDLFYRLNVLAIVIPPLRERRDDIPLLAAHFIRIFNRQFDRQVRGVSLRALEAMRRYPWPGNVRELKNAVERAFILEASDEIDLIHLPPEVTQPAPAAGQTLAAAKPDAAAGSPFDLQHTEVQLIRDALRAEKGNQTRAAKLLGITRDTLRYRLKKYGLQGADDDPTGE